MKRGTLLTRRHDVIANAITAAAKVAGTTVEAVWQAVEKHHLYGRPVTPAEMELIMAVEAAAEAQDSLIEQATARTAKRAAAEATRRLASEKEKEPHG